LFTRIINYAVGNPERDKELVVDTSDSYLGEENRIQVRSDKFPVSSELTFVKEGENLYSATFVPDEPGYYQFFDALVAINPHREYYELGQSDELSQMVAVSGGEMLSLDEEDLVERLKTLTTRTEQVRQDLSLFPLAIVLLLYIIEIFIRKLYEHKKVRS
jgi:hypothetical protein